MLLYSNEYSNKDKEYIKCLIIFFENKLKNISYDNKFNGFLVFLFHYIFLFIIYYLLLFFPISFSYYGIVFFWLGIVFSNIYFRGCLLTKLERHLWNTKDWFGPQYLFYDSSTLSNVMLQNLFICKFIFFATIIYLRILFKY